MSRKQAREIALQVMFQLDLNPLSADEDYKDGIRSILWDTAEEARFVGKYILSPDEVSFISDLVEGTYLNIAEIDNLINDVSTEWKVARMAVVDRNIVRMAIFEMRLQEEPTDQGIVINEAVELAKKFGTDESGRFVNGILGSIVRL